MLSVDESNKNKSEPTKNRNSDDQRDNENAETQVSAAGTDALPATETLDFPKKYFRLMTIARHAVRCLLYEAHDKKDKEYTQVRRHAARLAICGAYAIVNNDPEVPYKRATHFGHHISHPSSIRNVQKELGIGKAASFILQVTNRVALAMGPQQAHSKSVKHPEGGKSGGPRFVRRETLQLLDYKGTEVLSK
ncbi:hypothetical protein H2248_005552 [Termitomyces sp. 'cryptogamus']|nr:hypothetical protein H2248_005552 [Termitomyces sp. 'cryptogamus']